MKITDPEMAVRLLAEWQDEPAAAQLRKLKLARENLELDQMYYEQKGNDKGMARCEECLRLLRQREKELAATPSGCAAPAP